MGQWTKDRKKDQKMANSIIQDYDKRIQELEEERDIARNAGHALGYECGEDERIKLRKALKDIQCHEYSHDIIRMIATEALKSTNHGH